MLDVLCVIALVGLIVLDSICMWRIFNKAGRPGWLGLIPVVNRVVLLDVAGHSPWGVLLLFIPIVNIIYLLFVSLALADNFGTSKGFAVGLWLLAPIFYAILAFGKARYFTGTVTETPGPSASGTGSVDS